MPDRTWLRYSVAVSTLAWCGSAAAGWLDPPKPEVYQRAEDRERARLRSTPCTEADVGHGCYRYDDRILRESPCAFWIDAGTIGSLPTDECYKMEEPRRYRGVWINEFEGQAFVPEGTTAPIWPRGDPKTPGWSEKLEQARSATIWLDVEQTDLRNQFRRNGQKVLVEFVGRKTAYSGAYGHFGMAGHEIIVDRVLSATAVD